MRTWAEDIDGAADDTNEGAGDIDQEGGLYNMVARLLERIEGDRRDIWHCGTWGTRVQAKATGRAMIWQGAYRAKRSTYIEIDTKK